MKLRVHKKCEYGQSLCVLGSIPELGKWVESKCHLKWTEGNYWVLDEPLVISNVTQAYFSYKYVLMQNGKMKQWECGIDRIADLRLLEK